MDMIQSFWTNNIDSLEKLKMGWPETKYNLISWTLSAKSILKYYDNITLYTDDFGEEVLINKLHLPYTKVIKNYNTYENKYPPSIWAIMKMQTYKWHKNPFIHIDGDVYIYNKFPNKFLGANLIAQNLEINFKPYIGIINKIKKHYKCIPNEIKDIKLNNLELDPIIAVNCGIFGGNNLNFIKEYVSFSELFLEINKEYLSQDGKYLNHIIEQYFLYLLASRNKISIESLIDIPTTNESMFHFTNFPSLSLLSYYIHMMNGKNYSISLNEMEWKIKLDYRESYRLILSICKNKSKANSLKDKLNTNNIYYRSLNLLNSINNNRNNFAIYKLNNFKKYAINFLKNNLVPNDIILRWKELYEFESFKNKFIRMVCNNNLAIKSKIFKNITYLEKIKCSNNFIYSKLSLSKYSGIIDCKYNWAEKKEFKSQVESAHQYHNNLIVKPSFFRVFLIYLPNQMEIREYIGDTIDNELIETLISRRKISIIEILNIIQNKFKVDNYNFNKFNKFLINKILFLTWHGIVNIENKSFS